MAKTNKFNKSTIIAAGTLPARSTLIIEPHCKICKCPQRREVDNMLISGWTQSGVMRWLNGIYGENAFNKNNMSVHTNKHLTIHDAATRSIIEAKARQMAIDIDEAANTIMTRDAAAEATVAHIYGLMMEGKIEPEVRDMLKALEVLDKMEKDRADTTFQEMERDMRAFMTAVKRNVAEDLWDAIYSDFVAELERKPLGILPAPEPTMTEGEVIEDE